MFPPEWRPWLAERVRWWDVLSSADRDRIEDRTLAFLSTKRWEASNGFDLTDEIEVTIAGQAALLGLGLADDAFRGARTVLVHPSTYVTSGERYRARGIASRAPQRLSGQAGADGMVLLSWDAVLHEVSHPGTGRNVVVHELAHQLDRLTGSTDGRPPLPSSEEIDRWEAVVAPVYRQVEVGTGGVSIRSYAGVNRAEFFAVATEVFLDDPVTLRDEHPELYALLARFYGQDPVSRV